MHRTRPKWRDTRRKETAVRVFSVAQESMFILLFNVPLYASESDLVQILLPFGEVHALVKVTDQHPHEEFTDVYQVKYEKIASAKLMKAKHDEISLLGSPLHIQYAPELESAEETEAKFRDRCESVRCLAEGYQSTRARALLLPPQPATLANDLSLHPRESSPAHPSVGHSTKCDSTN